MRFFLRFLKLPFLAVALCLLHLQTSGAQTHIVLKDRSGRLLQVGLQLYSVRQDCAKDLPGVLAAVAKMGYTGVEFAGYHGRSAADLRKLLDENHLKCYGTHVDVNALQGDSLAKTA